MEEKDRSVHVPSDANGARQGRRPISLWIIPAYLLLSGVFAFLVSWQDPFASSLSKLLGVASAVVQAGTGALLLRGFDLGRRLYLVAMPIVIVIQAVYLGSIMGFTDDDYPFRALAPFLVYGVVVFFLMRSPVKRWLAASSQSGGGDKN